MVEITAGQGHGWLHPTRMATLLVMVLTVGGLFVGGALGTRVFDAPALPSVVAACMVAVHLGFKGVYRTRMVPDVSSMLSRVLTAVALGVVTGLAVALLTPAATPTIGDAVGLAFSLYCGAVVGLAISSTSLKRLWKAGHLRSKAVVVGVGQLTSELILELGLRRSYGVDIEGLAYVGERPLSTGHPSETRFFPLRNFLST